MNEYVALAQQLNSDPLDAWRWALQQRERNPSQELANAEHYLWNRYYASQGPLQAAGALVSPFGYYAGKKLGLLGGRSEPSLDQLQHGLFGAVAGMKYGDE